LKHLIISCLVIILSACGGGGGGSTVAKTPVTPTPPTQETVTIYYLHSTENYEGWGLHLWGGAVNADYVTEWANPMAPSGITDDYAFWTVPLDNANADFNFIVHFGDLKSPNYDLTFTPSSFGKTAWVVQDRVASTGSGITATPFDNEDDARAALTDLISELGNASSSLDLSPVDRLIPSSELSQDWSTNANFMEIYVRGYQDSDGDGVGDLQGLISRLDYLKDLGINALWLMPIMESSDNDHGYETQDYRAIESDYGSMQDFDELIAQAHQRGIAIIIDYVINHASSQNPLFLDARSNPDHAYRDWFIWSEQQPIWDTWSGNPWRKSPYGNYYGIFTERMPDFNLKNPEVIAFHQNNLRYWLNKGVDGFRFDAVGVLVENGADAWEAQPDNLTVMNAMRQVVEGYPGAYIVCEAPQQFNDMASAEACQRAFNFEAGHAILDSVKQGGATQALITELNKTNVDNMPLILANHDFFAGDRIYNQLNGNLEDYKLAAATYLLSSPNPFTYYGEEIGMAAAANLEGDASLRTPMSWSGDSLTAGFSTITPFRDLAANVASFNVSDTQADTAGLYQWYQSLYTLRNIHPLLSEGVFALLSEPNNPMLAFSRSNTNTKIFVAINFGDTAEQFTLNYNTTDSEQINVFNAQSTLSVLDSQSAALNVPAKQVTVWKMSQAQ